MKALSDLSEREVLALAIANEEEDSRIYQSFADRLRPEFDASAHVLAPDRRQVLAEALAVESVERFAMAALLLGHVLENVRGGVEIGAQAVGEALVDARILLLVGDRQREDFTLGQFGQGFHADHSLEEF